MFIRHWRHVLGHHTSGFSLREAPNNGRELPPWLPIPSPQGHQSSCLHFCGSPGTPPSECFLHFTVAITQQVFRSTYYVLGTGYRDKKTGTAIPVCPLQTVSHTEAQEVAASPPRLPLLKE